MLEQNGDFELLFSYFQNMFTFFKSMFTILVFLMKLLNSTVLMLQVGSDEHEHEHGSDEQIEKLFEALNSTPHLTNDVTIISENNEEIHTNKFLLSVFSPTLRPLLSTPCCTSHTLLIPDCSTSSIKHLLNIIMTGFSATDDDSFQDSYEILETAKLLSVDIQEIESTSGSHDHEKEYVCVQTIKKKTDLIDTMKKQKISHAVEKGESFINSVIYPTGEKHFQCNV